MDYCEVKEITSQTLIRQFHATMEVPSVQNKDSSAVFEVNK